MHEGGIMNKIKLKAFAKINLALDVLGTMPDGFHEVRMIMQQIDLHDDITVEWVPELEDELLFLEDSTDSDPPVVLINSNSSDIPMGQTNLVYKAAVLMAEKYGIGDIGTVRINIEKNIPVAAGLAGGSSDCASVLHALNLIWGPDLSLAELCEAGAALGSDVPFCVMGQAAANPELNTFFKDDPLAAHCALATGRGTDLTPLPGLSSIVVLSKPDISVSTAEVYRGIDSVTIEERPDIDSMIAALAENNHKVVEENMVNVLENFTLRRYPNVVYTKNKMSDLCKNSHAIMSGSGPTVFCLCETEEEADIVFRRMMMINRESFCTATTC